MRVRNYIPLLLVSMLVLAGGKVFAATYNNSTAMQLNIIKVGNIGDMCNPFLFRLRFSIEEYILHPKWLPFIPEQTKLMWEAQEALQLMNAINVSMYKCPSVAEKVLPSIENITEQKIQKISTLAPKVNMTPLVFEITQYHDRVLYKLAIRTHNETIKKMIVENIERQHRIMQKIMEKIVMRIREERQIRVGNLTGEGNLSMNATGIHVGPVKREIYRHFVRRMERMYCIQVYNPVECNGTVYSNMCEAIIHGENPAYCVPVISETHPLPIYIAINKTLKLNITPLYNMSIHHYYQHYYNYSKYVNNSMYMNHTYEHRYLHEYGYNYSKTTR